MKIEYVISTKELGSCNTDDDNYCYAKAVQNEIRKEYPKATIVVRLTDAWNSFCYVSDDPIGEIEERINLIANQVWSQANY